MKKSLLLIMVCTLLVCLSGCGAKTPAKAADGTPWSKDWITLGPTVGVEKPGHGLTIRDEKSARNMFYTAWSIGEAQTYVNASGDETNRYDAQLVVLLLSSDTTEEAQLSVDDQLALAEENYAITDISQQTRNGQEFTVLTYNFPSDTSAYAHGVSAFMAFDAWAISVEFAYQDALEEDAQEILADFLNHCHYAAD